jgi:peptidoglycan/LPS O-acetylase OafA/YrhL
LKESSRDNSRICYLDNIRAIIIVFVVVFHAILPYGYCPWWYVVDPVQFPFSFYFIVLLEPVLMPVLFFIAGLLAWPSLLRNGTARFMATKANRLLLPFLLCTLLLGPIMPFVRQALRALDSGGDPAGFWRFWIGFLQSVSTVHSGSASTSTEIVVNQYWFLMLLFIFFAGFGLFVSIRRTTPGENPDNPVGRPPSRPKLLGLIAAFSLVLGAIYAVICLFISGNLWVTLGGLWQVQPAKIHIYLGLFLAGICVERKNLLPQINSITRPAVWLAAVVAVAAAYLAAVIKTAGVPDASMTLVIASRFLRIFLVVTVSLWLLGFFRQTFNRSTAVWSELSTNSYNIYLIHMAPQVVIQMMFLAVPVPSPLKWIFVSLLTLLVSYTASRFVVKKSPRAAVVALVVLVVVLFLSLP